MSVDSSNAANVAIRSREFGTLAGERVRVDFLEQPQVQQFILLLSQVGHLPLQFLGLFLTFLPLIFRSRPQHVSEPVGRIVVLLHGLESREDLFIQFAFRDAVAPDDRHSSVTTVQR